MIAAALAILKSLSWQAYVMVALAAACAGVYAVDGGRITLLKHDLASMTKDRDGLTNSIAMAKQLAVETDAAYRAKDLKTAADQKEASDEAQRLSIRARDDSSAVHTALGKLLDRAAARSGQAASGSSPAEGSAATQGTGLRTDLLGSVGGEAERYADIADQARIRGAQCEADYDAVAKPIESERGDDDKP